MSKRITLPNIDDLRQGDAGPLDFHQRHDRAKQLRSQVWQTMSNLMSNAPDGQLKADEARSYDEAEKLYDELDRIVEQTTIDRSGVVARAVDTRGYTDGVPLTANQTFTGFAHARGQVPENQEGLSLRNALRGVVTGDWGGDDRVRAAMTESSLAGGGYLLPTVLSTQIIDLARNQTRVMQAGARIFPMTNKKLDVAKWAGDPSMAWHSESAAISQSDATIGKVTLDAKTLTGLTLISRELLEDADGVDDELKQAFASVLAAKVDIAALYGTGTAPEPLGVKNTAGILTASMGANGAALTNYDPLVDAVGTLRDNNEDPTGVIYSPRTARAIGKLKDTTNQPLSAPDYLDGIPRYDTNQVPNNLTQGTSNLASDIFTADWRQLYIGLRTQLQITVLSERYADTGQIGILAWYRGDVVVARPKAFHVTTGVL